MSVVTTDNFERFVVRGHNRLDVMGREGVCNSYTLYAGQDMPEALWGLLGNRTGYMTLDDTANSCAMDLVIEANGTIAEVAAARYVRVPSDTESAELIQPQLP
ncbi:MAG: hypothetical protein LRZ85_01415 [Alphaproteobacteria bacterium]|nr:hypothetical protein [Alphaproteobacteria bacterium]